MNIGFTKVTKEYTKAIGVSGPTYKTVLTTVGGAETVDHVDRK